MSVAAAVAAIIKSDGEIVGFRGKDSQDSFLLNTNPYEYYPSLNNGTLFSYDIPQLDPINWYEDALYQTDGVYIYGRSSSAGNVLVKYPMSLSAPAINGFSAPSGGAITFVKPTSIPGLIFIHVQTPANFFDVYRSTDYGATATLVFQMGMRNTLPPVSGARSTNIRWLSDRNLCEADVGGRKVFIMGEYNTNASRTVGGNNDAVCIYRSNDLGLTWQIIAEWNTDGNTAWNGGVANAGNYVRHIHAVIQHPVTKLIYICFGDVGLNEVQAGIMQWDGRATITNNQLLSAYIAAGIVTISGNQRYRAVDILFDDDGSMTTLADSISGGGRASNPCGIFKFTKDFLFFDRIDHGILDVPNSRSGRLGVSVGGYHIWSEAIEDANNTAGAYFVSFHTSSRDKSRYGRNAVVRCKTGGVFFSIDTLFADRDGNIYATFTQPSMLGFGGTIVFRPNNSVPWNGERPDTLHPVYYVDPSGTDATSNNQGRRPGSGALKTLKYACEGSRVPHGARIVLPAGTFSELTINPVWSTATADTTEYVNISGQGMDKTHVGNSQAAGADLIRGSTAGIMQHWDFQDIHLTTYKSGGSSFILAYYNYLETNPFKLRIIRSRIGYLRSEVQAGMGATMPIRLNSSAAIKPIIRIIDSQIVQKSIADFSNSTVLFYQNDVANIQVFLSAQGTIFWGGVVQHGGTGSTARFVDCIFGGSTNPKGNINIMATATVSPSGLRCIFDSEPDTGVQIINDSSNVAAAAQFIRCVTSRPLDNVGFFDVTSQVITGGQTKDSYLNDYRVPRTIWE